MVKTKLVFQDFQSALDRFEEVMTKSSDDLKRDAAVKRFEFTFELAWKTMKYYLSEAEGEITTGSKDVIRKAFVAKLIEYNELWIEMVELRNRTVHTYNLAFVQELYETDLPKILLLFKELEKNIACNLINKY